MTLAAAVLGASAAAFVVVTAYDPNAPMATSVVNHAGIQPGVHVGPTWKAQP